MGVPKSEVQESVIFDGVDVEKLIPPKPKKKSVVLINSKSKSHRNQTVTNSQNSYVENYPVMIPDSYLLGKVEEKRTVGYLRKNEPNRKNAKPVTKPVLNLNFGSV